MTFLPMLQPSSGNSECKSNPVPQQVYTYLSGSAF